MTLPTLMLAAATSFFSRTAISQSYNIGTTNISRSGTPTPSGSSTPVSQAPTVRIGLWKVQGATHKVTHKRVSVWTLDKRVEMDGLGPSSRERVLGILKAEVLCRFSCRYSCLTPLYIGNCPEQTSPSIYPWYDRLLLDCYIALMIRVLKEMVEPLEETRTELIFATEPVLSSLELSIPRNSHHTPIVELDEIEVCDTSLLYLTEITHR